MKRNLTKALKLSKYKYRERIQLLNNQVKKQPIWKEREVVGILRVEAFMMKGGYYKRLLENKKTDS